ncbi:ADP-heptose:LPS heptosyltransferase [Roseateles sp. YR242]|uniref:glycosyltransferase family 9 protein n=1 Tax=Roseateles sp. YR242 TaxID=1855305 RepID=UPI0008B618D8|nr:glycosyltransferase family 9 protein [Roseateles sp. YR242]SEL19420.1 ADP-heptose:LPS heptosyltransferase [Roseateles sp. YR242]
MTKQAVSEVPDRRWSNVRRILLVRLDSPDGVVISTPAFAAVRETLPWAHLTLLAAPAAEALRPHLEMLNEIVGFNAPWMKAGAAMLDAEAPDMRGEAERHMVRRLGRGHFDAAVIFTAGTQSAMPAALMCRMAGIPLALAYVQERAYGLLSDEVPEEAAAAVGAVEGLQHEIDRQLALVGHVGLRIQDDRLRFRMLPRDERAVQQLLKQAGLPSGQGYVLVHLDPGEFSRRHPPQALGEALDLLQDASAADGAAIVFCGEPTEQSLIEAVRRVMSGPSLVLARSPALGELATLIAGARVLVSSPDGPVALATAVGTTVVDLEALTDPQETPWRVAAPVLEATPP